MYGEEKVFPFFSATKCPVAWGSEENSVASNDISVTENIRPYKNLVETIENLVDYNRIFPVWSRFFTGSEQFGCANRVVFPSDSSSLTEKASR